MGDLTTKALVKDLVGLTVTTWDTRLDRLVSAVSARIEAYCGRVLTQATYTDEAIDSFGESRVSLRQYPVTAVSAVAELGVALGASDYAIEGPAGQLIRLSGGSVIRWAPGLRAVLVSYTAGYSTIPKDLEDAATQQAAHEWQKTKEGGGRIGLETSVSGPGTGNYITEPWLPGVEEAIRAHRRIA